MTKNDPKRPTLSSVPFPASASETRLVPEVFTLRNQSGREDSNLRPLDPQFAGVGCVPPRVLRVVDGSRGGSSRSFAINRPGSGIRRGVQLLTVAEVAAELQVTKKTVLSFIAAGELRAIQGLGRGLGYRIRREWLDAFLHAREKAVGVAPADPPGVAAPRRKVDGVPSMVEIRRRELIPSPLGA